MLAHSASRLNCTTPELADVWNAIFPAEPRSYTFAERDLNKRAELRAHIDALVAELYGVTPAGYALLLTGFPLLDRDQAKLPGDHFATEGDESLSEKDKAGAGVRWQKVDNSIVELQPSSFVTRDLALLRYVEHKKLPLPEDLHAWFRDEVGIDPDGPLSRFRIGSLRNLKERVLQARKLGAVAYLPAGGAQEVGEVEDV